MSVPVSDESKDFSFSKWLAEGMEAMLPRRLAPRFIPADTRTHIRAARREMLMAARSLLDEVIEKVDKAPAAPKKVTKIKVE